MGNTDDGAAGGQDIVERLREASQRFYSLFTPGKPQACWNWQGDHFTNGYGRFNVARTALSASRAAMLLICGPLDTDAEVCHRCDNRSCVNPFHLYIGTAKTNALDKVARGWQARFPGESNGQAKLTESLVKEIRDSDEFHRAIARRLGVSESLIRQVRSGEGWRHV